MTDLVSLVSRSLEARASKLPSELLKMRGMSGYRYRIFINNLISQLPNARYLEVGCWTGSTACAAIFGNRIQATFIDNWSKFGGPRAEFLTNLKHLHNPKATFRLFDSDFHSLDYTAMGTHNVYLYDGHHSQRAQSKGIVLPQPALDEVFVLVVDDWNWDRVRLGTWDGIARAGLQTLFSKEIRTTSDGHHARPAGAKTEWHNGYLVGVFRKAPP